MFVFRYKYGNVYNDMLLGFASNDKDDRKELQSGDENEIRSATRWQLLKSADGGSLDYLTLNTSEISQNVNSNKMTLFVSSVLS